MSIDDPTGPRRRARRAPLRSAGTAPAPAGAERSTPHEQARPGRPATTHEVGNAGVESRAAHTAPTTLPHDRRREPQADDFLESPASDEAAGRIHLLDEPDFDTGGLFAPGEAENEAGETRRRSWRQAAKDSFDFSRLRKSPYGLAPLLTLSGISFFQQLDSAAFTLAGPDIARDLNIDVGDIIGIVALVGTVSVFASILAGYYADRVRRTPFIWVGTMLSGVATFFAGLSNSFSPLSTSRVANAAADDGSGVPRLSLFADYYPYDVRGKAFAFNGALGRIGQIAAPLFTGYLIVELGWQTAFKIIGVPLLVMGVISIFTLREPIRGFFERKALGATDEQAAVEDEPLSFAESFRTTFAVRTIRRRTIADIFASGASSVSGLFFIFFAAEEYGLNAFELGLLTIPAALTGIAGGLYGGTLVDRLTRVNPSRVIYIVAVFGLVAAPWPLLYILTPPLWVIVGALAVISFGASMIGPSAAVVNVQVIPANIRTFGLQLTDLSRLVGPVLWLPIARQLNGDYGYDAIWIMAFLLSLVGAAIDLSAAPFFELDMRAAFAKSVASQEYQRAKLSGETKLLVARNLDVYYDNVQVLFDVDFDVEEGEILALLGTNGAGKSTVLRAMCGVQPARSGAVIFDGRDITQMPSNEIAARGVIEMPGGRGIFPSMSVRENLLLGNWMSDDVEDAKARMREVFEIFPRLTERLDVPAGTLSGGEQQQLSLAQAFLCKPKMLLIDELSLGLSPAVVGQLVEIVKEINRRGVTVIVVEQSVNVALTIADKAIFMEKGEVRFYGPTQDLLDRPDILRAVYVKGTGALTSGTTAAAGGPIELADAAPALEVEGLVKDYGGVRAVNDVSFALREGEVLGLIGPNGAGKTTIFDLISGAQPLDGGVVRFQGVELNDLSPQERARMGLIRRFQDARLFPSLTVEETILIALEQKLEVRSSILGAISAPQVRKAERRARVRAERLIELLEIGAFRDKFVRELSTGLRRIVDLACVLAAEPKVLLLDEPSSGIAQAEAEGLAPLLRRVKFETGCSILIIEHDMPLISAVSDELIALEQGTFVTRGLPDDVLNDERVIESYLGTSEAAINRSGSLA